MLVAVYLENNSVSPLNQTACVRTACVKVTLHKYTCLKNALPGNNNSFEMNQ